MPPYKDDSGWNDKNEMRCFLIFKKLEEKKFSRGMQARLCKEMADTPGISLSQETVNAKVGNYKSVARVTRSSNASTNTKRIYEKFKNYSIAELERKIDKCSCFI